MASATAIPNCGNSAHHTGHSQGSRNDLMPPDAKVHADGNMPMSYSPNNTSPPRGIVSPIYTQAGRSAFSMPGPNSASTSPTTTSWYSAGFASGNSQRVRSPTLSVGGFAGTQNPGSTGTASHTRGASIGTIQRDYFGSGEPAAASNGPASRHFRTGSFSSGTSSISSADLEPVTPRGSAGSLNQASLEQIKGGTAKIPTGPAGRRESWAFSPPSGASATIMSSSASRWTGGLGSLRDRQFPPSSMPADLGAGSSGSALDTSDASAQVSGAGGGMSNLFRKLSFGASPTRPASQQPSTRMGPTTATMAAPETMAHERSESTPTVSSKDTKSMTAPVAPLAENGTSGRLGRRTTVAGTSAAAVPPRRRPSPMGERLLMGHFSGHH